MVERGNSTRSGLLNVKEQQNWPFWLSSSPLPRITTWVHTNAQCENVLGRMIASHDFALQVICRLPSRSWWKSWHPRGEMLRGVWATQELQMCVTKSRTIWNLEGGSQFRFLSSIVLMDMGPSCERAMVRRYEEEFIGCLKYFGPSFSVHV